MNKRYAIYWISNSTTGATGNGKFVFNTRNEALDYIKSCISEKWQSPYFTYTIVSN